MRLLVLGGTRFLGRHLVDAALDAGHDVTIFTRGNTPAPWRERVTHLVLYGAFAAGLNHVGQPHQLEARHALVSLMRLGWGLKNPAFCRLFTCRFVPDAGANTLPTPRVDWPT